MTEKYDLFSPTLRKTPSRPLPTCGKMTQFMLIVRRIAQPFGTSRGMKMSWRC